MKQVNFNNYKDSITEDDINQVYDLLAKGTRSKTRTRLMSCLTYGKGRIPTFGILERLIKEDGKWRYIAGQSYPDEIRTVRELIIK